MTYLTQQQIFTKVATHLLTQMARCEEPGAQPSCLYRSPDGLKCAVGCLIPDTVDVTAFNSSCITLLPDNVWNAMNIKNRDVGFLQELQRIHDRCSVVTWRRDLTRVAATHGLEMVGA